MKFEMWKVHDDRVLISNMETKFLLSETGDRARKQGVVICQILNEDRERREKRKAKQAGR